VGGLLHLHRPAGLRGFVDRADDGDGDGVAGVAAGDGGLALFADGAAAAECLRSAGVSASSRA
jgi:hypothetical protein